MRNKGGGAQVYVCRGAKVTELPWEKSRLWVLFSVSWGALWPLLGLTGQAQGLNCFGALV